jgi:hypothetical protein
MGSASRASSSLVSLALMLLAGFWFSGRSSSGFVLALVLGCAHVAQAHNWVYSVSRSFNQASTYKPCRPKVNDSPHWQINQGQLFNMEWATGHDHYFYFTIVAAKDMELLNNVTERDLNNYLDPASCLSQYDYMRTKTGNPQMWEKQHIEYNPNNFDQKDTAGNNIYERRLNFTDKPRLLCTGLCKWKPPCPGLGIGMLLNLPLNYRRVTLIVGTDRVRTLCSTFGAAILTARMLICSLAQP